MRHPYVVLLRRSVNLTRRSVNFLWLVAAAGYLLFSAGQVVARNYQSQKEIKSLKEELNKAIMERERLEALLVYYQTDSFKEKELRRTLLMKRPEERVYALPESGVAKALEEEMASKQPKEKKESQSQVWRQWAEYFFGEKE